MILRHQLPVHSPIPLGSLVGATSARRTSDVGAELAAIIADRFDARRVVLTGSGTQALNLAIRSALASTESAIVGLPGFCCYDVASAAVGAGARIALYDIEPGTLAPDLASVERLLASTGTKVLVLAHLYGYPADWEKLQAIASRFGATLIEDAAQGQGGSWRGRPLGSLGGLSVLSFGRGKGWTGSGGGALLLREGWDATPTPDLPDAGSSWKILAGGLAHWMLGRPSVYGLPSSLPWLGLGETHYHAPVPPVRMHPTSVAIALRSMAASDREARGRKEAAGRLRRGLAGTSTSGIEVLEGADPGYLRLPVRVRGGLQSFPSPEAALTKGVGRSYPTTLDALPVVVERLAGERALPGAATLARELITLPVHSLVRKQEEDSIISLLQTILPR